MTKVTGELISIDDSAYDGFKGMTVYGKTVQNLWANPSISSPELNVKPNASGSVTISGARSTVFTAAISNYAVKPSTTYVLSCDKTVGSISGTFFAISDIREDGRYDLLKVHSGYSIATIPPSDQIVQLACAIRISAGDDASGTYRVMLREATAEEIEQGKVLDDYWCPPGLSSVDSLSSARFGKNLTFFVDSGVSGSNNGVSWEKNADGSFHIWGKNNIGARFAISQGNVASVDYSSMLDNIFASDDLPTKITAYCPGAGSMVYVQMNSIKPGVITESSVVSTVNLAVPVTSSTVQGCTRINTFLGIAKNFEGDFVVYPQIEFGDTATDFEKPYVYNTTIDLQSNSLRSLPDGTRDELHIDEEGNCTLVKRVGISTMPSDADSWSLVDDSVGYRYRYYLGSGDAAATFTTPDTEMCDRLPIRSNPLNPGSGVHIFASGRYVYASVGSNESAQDVADVCGGGHILYPLATPQTISLGKISLPKLRKKPLVNNVWANGTASGTNFSLAPEIDYEYNAWSTFCEGFKTHGKHSYFDMGCCIAARDTGTPEKKSVTATVPYMSGFYDLSKLYGAIAFEARQLMYRFEFVEDSREELQRKKSQFLEWLSQVHDEKIADDDIPGRHFIGSLSGWEFEEGEEGQSGSLEVTFNCQPFLEADEDTTKTCNAGSNTVTVEGQAVNAYAKTNSGTATIQIGGVTQSVGTTEIRLSVQLQPGDNAVTVTGSPVVLRWKELTV